MSKKLGDIKVTAARVHDVYENWLKLVQPEFDITEKHDTLQFAEEEAKIS